MIDAERYLAEQLDSTWLFDVLDEEDAEHVLQGYRVIDSLVARVKELEETAALLDRSLAASELKRHELEAELAKYRQGVEVVCMPSRGGVNGELNDYCTVILALQKDLDGQKVIINVRRAER